MYNFFRFTSAFIFIDNFIYFILSANFIPQKHFILNSPTIILSTSSFS